jgi:hypothetical protein
MIVTSQWGFLLFFVYDISFGNKVKCHFLVATLLFQNNTTLQRQCHLHHSFGPPQIANLLAKALRERHTFSQLLCHAFVTLALCIL